MIPQKYRNSWKSHLNHVDPISECQKHLYEIARELDPGNNDKFKYTLIKLNVEYMLFSINEVNTNIISCLKSMSYSTAEILSRASSELSANLIYVIEGNENDRAKSLLKDYYRSSKANAKKWLEYAEKNNIQEDIVAAQEKLSIIDRIRESMGSIFSSSIAAWPGTQQKFKSIDLECFYHHTFAPASNSTHSLSEDIYQIFYREHFPPEYREESILAYMEEKASFAIYLSASVIGMFAECVGRCCIRSDREDLLLQVKDAIKPINRILNDHQNMVDDLIRSSEEWE